MKLGNSAAVRTHQVPDQAQPDQETQGTSPAFQRATGADAAEVGGTRARYGPRCGPLAERPRNYGRHSGGSGRRVIDQGGLQGRQGIRCKVQGR